MRFIRDGKIIYSSNFFTSLARFSAKKYIKKSINYKQNLMLINESESESEPEYLFIVPV